MIPQPGGEPETSIVARRMRFSRRTTPTGTPNSLQLTMSQYASTDGLTTYVPNSQQLGPPHQLSAYMLPETLKSAGSGVESLAGHCRESVEDAGIRRFRVGELATVTPLRSR